MKRGRRGLAPPLPWSPGRCLPTVKVQDNRLRKSPWWLWSQILIIFSTWLLEDVAELSVDLGAADAVMQLVVSGAGDRAWACISLSIVAAFPSCDDEHECCMISSKMLRGEANEDDHR